MKKIWKEFRAFALSGSMLDLALGFLIATEFTRIIDPITDTIVDEIIAAAFGKDTIKSWHVSLNGQRIDYGLVMAALINFVFFAVALFLGLKLVAAVGLGRRRDFVERQCPYCLEYIPPHALVCRVCRNQLVAQMPDLDAAELRAAKLRERRHLKLPIDVREFDFPEFDMPKMRRRSATPKVTVTKTGAVAVVVEETRSDTGGTTPA